MEREVLEAVLIREAAERRVSRILKVETEPAVPKGENYLSVITRIRLTVVLGSGRIVKRSLILKDTPKGENKVKMVKELSVFQVETKMYTEVLRAMESLMEEFQDTNDVLWPKLLHYEPYSSILFEDLKSSGFKLARRQDCLDLQHGLLVVRSLGRFHGMCKVLEERGIINKDDYKPYPLISDKTTVKMFLYEALQAMCRAMNSHWGPEWADVAQRLNIPYDVLTDTLMELGKVDESRFNVLCHGDCWSSNMMFKYDAENRPYTMRFLDFQIPHYNSPCWDLTYTIYTGFEPAARRANYGRLLDSYCCSLLDTLGRLGYAGPRPNHEDISRDMDRLRFFTVPCVTFLHGVMTADTTEAFDLEAILKSEGLEGHNEEIYRDQAFKDRIADDLKDLVSTGVI